MMVSFVLSFFPRDVLDEILNLIESVSEDFLTTLLITLKVFLMTTYVHLEKRHGCQTTLMRLLEDWKEAVDSNHYVAAVLMGLSKAS